MKSYYIKFVYCIGNYDFSKSAYTYTQITPSVVTLKFEVENQEDVDYMADQIRKIEDKIINFNAINTNFVYKRNGKIYSSVITCVIGFNTDFSDYLEDEDEE